MGRPKRTGQDKKRRRRAVASKPGTYKRLRQSIGTQEEVAKMLGLHKQTLSDRERGLSPITREALYAMRFLVERSKS